MTDPWNQNFATFKNAYQENNRNPSATIRPGFAVFKISELLSAGATHIVFYTVEEPIGSGKRKTAAVAISNATLPIQRVAIANKQYGLADHNCPPDCEGNLTNPPLDSLNLNYPGSIN